ncbi:inositol monophosphatase [Pelomyxa schiedti]|nr:inositol monophosphatase [Pelomyxa schiedti]
MDAEPSLDFLKEVALNAGAIVRQGIGRSQAIEHKNRIDLVTETDKLSEAYITSAIKAKFPSHTIVAEESGRSEGTAADSVWYIDPLDGTTNFAHGYPTFAVCIAFARGPQNPVLGAVYDVARDELFAAQAGRGATLNGRPCRRGGGASEPADLLGSLLVTGFAPRDWVIAANAAHFGRLIGRCQGIRNIGSAAVSMCSVAAGRMDAYWEVALQPWDSAAAALVARESGAVVTALDGDECFLKPPYGVLVSAPTIHRELLSILMETPASPPTGSS